MINNRGTSPSSYRTRTLARGHAYANWKRTILAKSRIRTWACAGSRVDSQLQEVRAVIHASWCRDVRARRPHSLTSTEPRSFRLFRRGLCLDRLANSLISRGGHCLIQSTASRWPVAKLCRSCVARRCDVRVFPVLAPPHEFSLLLRECPSMSLIGPWSSLHSKFFIEIQSYWSLIEASLFSEESLSEYNFTLFSIFSQCERGFRYATFNSFFFLSLL